MIPKYIALNATRFRQTTLYCIMYCLIGDTFIIGQWKERLLTRPSMLTSCSLLSLSLSLSLLTWTRGTSKDITDITDIIDRKASSTCTKYWYLHQFAGIHPFQSCHSAFIPSFSILHSPFHPHVFLFFFHLPERLSSPIRPIKMLFYLAFAAPVLLTTAWLYTAHITRVSIPKFQNKRICLLIAHPDDEAMFFSPTLLALTDERLGNHVKILCLSTGTPICLRWWIHPLSPSSLGNADNLGQTRKEELLSSAVILGLRSPADVFVLDSPSFPDSMTSSWDPKEVANVLSSAFASAGSSQNPQKKIASKTKTANDPPLATIDILLTFDSRGVSHHPNHISLYRGAHAWLTTLMTNRSGWKCPVELYTLTTTNIVRKYITFLDAPVTMLLGALEAARENKNRKAEGRKIPRRILFVSDLAQWRKGQKAMTRGHQSQMRWFRWGWIGVGRYMVVNDLKRETIT